MLPMLVLTSCPEPSCGAPAEITDRFTLESTDGPVELVKTMCLHRHWFLCPASYLTSPVMPKHTEGPRTLKKQ